MQMNADTGGVVKQAAIVFVCTAFVLTGCNDSPTDSNDDWGSPATVDGFWRTVKVNHYRPDSDTLFMEDVYGNTVKEITRFSGSIGIINTKSDSYDCYNQIDLTLELDNGTITLGRSSGDSIVHISTKAYLKNDTLKMRWHANEYVNRDMEVFMVKYQDNLPFPICTP